MTKAEFARYCGVSGSTVTRLLKTLLKECYDGNHIDPKHPDAIAYKEKRTGRRRQEPKKPPPATGVDPLYEEVLAWCRKHNRFTKTGIRQQFKIGDNRAIKLLALMDAAGVKHTRSIAPTQRPAPAPKAENTAPAEPQFSDDNLPDDVKAYADYTVRQVVEKFGGGVQFLHWLNAMQKIQGIEEKQLKNAQTRRELIRRDLVHAAVIDPFNSVLLRLLQDGSKTIAAGLKAKVEAGATLPELELFVTDQIGSYVRPVKDKVMRGLRGVEQDAA